MNSKIYGETEAEDCPKGQRCYCTSKTGFLLSGGNHGAKKPHIDAPSPLPMRKIKSYGAFFADTFNKGNQFINFPINKTHCDAEQRLFGLIETASDYIPVQNFEYTTFDNVHASTYAFIMDPPEKWNNLDDCIGFPCTAPSNVVMSFKYSKHLGKNTLDGRSRNFQIVSDVSEVSDTYNNCEFMETWNAWHCENDYLG